MLDRCMRIFRLDRTVFDEIAADPAATVQAAVWVLVGVLAPAVQWVPVLVSWSPFSAVMSDETGISFNGIYLALALLSSAALVAAWLLLAWLGHFVGSRWFRGQGSYIELLRVVGCAQIPRVLVVAGFIPVIGSFAGALGGGLATVATILAMQRIMRTNLGETVLSWLVPNVVVWIVTAGLTMAVWIPMLIRIVNGFVIE